MRAVEPHTESAALPFAFACECCCAHGIPPPREIPPGPHLKLLENALCAPMTMGVKKPGAF